MNKNDLYLLKQPLEITEQHFFLEFSYENTREYKRRLQELVGKMLNKHPEYKESIEFQKFLNPRGNTYKKKYLIRTIQSAAKIKQVFVQYFSRVVVVRIKSLTKATPPPTKEEMERLMPSSWPSKWVEVDRYSQDGLITVSLAHINPAP